MEDTKLQVMEIAPRENENKKEIWRSCCLDMDKQVVLYTTKTIFSGIILGFCLIQVAKIDSSCHPLISWYTGLIGTVLGSFVEQSSHKMYKK